MNDRGTRNDSVTMNEEFYPTPTDIPTETRCLVLHIPDSDEWYGMAIGALWELMRLQNYEKVGIDVDLTIDRWLEVFHTMEFDCMTRIIGEVAMLLTDTIPPKWFELNGQGISKTTYPELFEIFGYTHGGAFDIFVLPSYRGRSPYGSGADIATRGTGGATTRNIAVNNLPPHNHPVNDPGHNHVPLSPNTVFRTARSGGSSGYATVNASQIIAQDLTTASATTGITTGNTGSGDGINILHPVFGARMIIYAGR